MKYTNTGSASPVSHVFFTFQVQRGLQATSEFQNPHFQNEAKCTTFIVKMNYTSMRMKNISIPKAERLFWYRGPGELGNGLLGRGDILGKRENPGVEITHDLTPDTFF